MSLSEIARDNAGLVMFTGAVAFGALYVAILTVATPRFMKLSAKVRKIFIMPQFDSTDPPTSTTRGGRHAKQRFVSGGDNAELHDSADVGSAPVPNGRNGGDGTHQDVYPMRCGATDSASNVWGAGPVEVARSRGDIRP